MLIPTTLLLFLPLIGAATTGGRTAADCTVGDKWTDNYIRFECYNSTTTKGVRAIGCVPTNTENGAIVELGKTHDEQYFTYSCSKTGNTVSYAVINCRDHKGVAIAVGESRTVDGKIWKCFKDETGMIKLSSETAEAEVIGGGGGSGSGGAVTEGVVVPAVSTLLPAIPPANPSVAPTNEPTTMTIRTTAARNQEPTKEPEEEGGCITPCSSLPCKNGGQCSVDNSLQGYRCTCPEDTAGKDCETKISCSPSTCGTNARCFIANHQTNCACNPGFAGDPFQDCEMQMKKACLTGDPHYTTFDGTTFEYMGTCPYIFSMPCKGSLPDGYTSYSVKARSVKLSPNDTVSWNESYEVEFYGKTIFVNNEAQVFVDNVQVYVPYYFPSQTNPKTDFAYLSVQLNSCSKKVDEEIWAIDLVAHVYTSLSVISITTSNGYIIIANDQYVTTVSRGNKLCIKVPDVAAFRGKDTLCGVAGNIDGDGLNDFILRDGSQLPIDSHPRKEYCNRFGDSWIIDDYSSPTPSCEKGETVTLHSDECDTTESEKTCSPINDAMQGKGVFGGCKALGEVILSELYSSCVYDVCAMKDIKCTTLAMFVRECQDAVAGVDISKWREELECPMICPAKSKYSTCTTACPATCASYNKPEKCDQLCSEGCECEPGYVLDTTVLQTTTCVPIDQCGCTDPNGNMHPAGQEWLSDDCSQLNRCGNGTFRNEPHKCGTNAICGVENSKVACICPKGFKMNTETDECEDIDECENGNICSVGKEQGACFNNPGSYTCLCKPNYGGENCESFAPRRHCADLYVYHGIREDGPYQVTVPGYGNTTVYCDMTRGGGGWTLMGNSHTDSNSHRTYEEYITGFGTVTTTDQWIGLTLINIYTSYQSTSLRVNLHRCARNGLEAKWTDCTYKKFSVSDKDDGFRVTIPEVCEGSEISHYDGWVRWDLTKPGPKFMAMDNDVPVADSCVRSNITSFCSAAYRNTGWWFDTTARCGSANLNGVRFECDAEPVEAGSYLHWGGSPISKADMWIRPTLFPDYEMTVAVV